jgi:predicted transcriptional regulator
VKSVLISIQPKWCELIANGEKTVEIRKTKPKLKTPFKVYIYCTKGETIYLPRDIFGNNALNGKVIGEFVCDRIDYWTYYWQPDVMHIVDMSKSSCVGVDELLKYSNNGKDTLYAWHISDLVIYDKPKELSEFKSITTYGRKLRTEFFGKDPCCVNDYRLSRPPQSWCYVERSVNNGK